jgi:hypothetical protein
MSTPQVLRSDIYKLRKAELQAILKEFEEPYHPKETVDELRSRVLQWFPLQEKDPMSPFTGLKKEDMLKAAVALGIECDGKMTRGQILLKIRAFVMEAAAEEEAHEDTILTIGKHKGKTYGHIYNAHWDYIKWARGEILTSSTASDELKMFVEWTYRQESKKVQQLVIQNLKERAVKPRPKVKLPIKLPYKKEQEAEEEEEYGEEEEEEPVLEEENDSYVVLAKNAAGRTMPMWSGKPEAFQQYTMECAEWAKEHAEHSLPHDMQDEELVPEINMAKKMGTTPKKKSSSTAKSSRE